MASFGYYGFLATRFAPQRLLATAALRAVRVARNRLAPPLAPPPDRVLAALGCADPEALAGLLATRPRPAPPAWTPEALAHALDRHLPGERARALLRAEDAAAGRFEVYGRRVEARRDDGGTDWQLDAIHGGRFASWAPSAALPPAPDLDPKMAWALARGESWVALACGAVLSRRDGDRLEAALGASVRDFEAQNPVGQGVHWVTAMEVGLRAHHLALALWLLSARRRPLAAGLALDAARLLVASGRFVVAHLEDDTAVPNNHLVCDLLGLLGCAAWLPDWPEAPRWRALALEGLRRALAEQVHPEGTSFEGSVPYHRLALELFTAGALAAHAAGAPLGRAAAGRLRAMFRATRALLASSGDLPQLGDNDSGHALSVRARGPVEGGYLLPLGAALFRDPSLLVRPGGAAEVAWFLGPGALAFVATAHPGPPPRSAVFPAAGFHAVRRGPFEAFVSCGPNGQRGIGGHNHNDKLALELRVAGALGVCDPGMPVYGRDPGLRDAFRATRAHATVTVDGLEQAALLPGRTFALPEAAGARVIAFEAGPDADHLAGEHHGYVGRAGVVHRRDVWATAGGVAVVDRLQGDGTHAVELRWPVAWPAPRIRPLSPAELAAIGRLAALARLRRPPDAARGVEVLLRGAGRLLLAFACPSGLVPEVAPSLRSPGYGELADAAVVLLAGPVACPAALATFFLHLPEPPAGARGAGADSGSGGRRS